MSTYPNTLKFVTFVIMSLFYIGKNIFPGTASGAPGGLKPGSLLRKSAVFKKILKDGRKYLTQIFRFDMMTV